jgi:hypothetical protein
LQQVDDGWSALLEEYGRPPSVVRLPFRAAIRLATGSRLEVGEALHDAVAVPGVCAVEAHLIPALLGSRFVIDNRPGAVLRFE